MIKNINFTPEDQVLLMTYLESILISNEADKKTLTSFNKASKSFFAELCTLERKNPKLSPIIKNAKESKLFDGLELDFLVEPDCNNLSLFVNHKLLSNCDNVTSENQLEKLTECINELEQLRIEMIKTQNNGQ